MSLVTSINDTFTEVADQLNLRPVSAASDMPPTNPKDKQFWRRSDNALFQYSELTGQMELVSANIVTDRPIDGGNF